MSGHLHDGGIDDLTAAGDIATCLEMLVEAIERPFNDASLEAARASREAVRDRLAAASLARLNAPDPETFQADALERDGGSGTLRQASWSGSIHCGERPVPAELF